MYAVESTEIWFEDLGSGQLVNGSAVILLDPMFLETVTIDDQHPMKVFITLTDEANGVYVTKGKDAFVVTELMGGQSNATFDYRVVAKRRSLENVRLAPFDDALDGVESSINVAPAHLRIPNDGDDIESTVTPRERPMVVPSFDAAEGRK